jgi:cytochrome c-type biogenesis protein CcmH
VADVLADPAPIRARRTPGAVVTGRLSAVLMVVVLGVALAVGSGLGHGAPASLSSRAAAVESRIRCPSCEDISVAQSQASSAIAARHQITRMLAAGDSDAMIEQSFVDRYGPSILLVPPSSGLGALVWVLPLVAVVLAVGSIGVLFWRRQRLLMALRADEP